MTFPAGEGAPGTPPRPPAPADAASLRIHYAMEGEHGPPMLLFTASELETIRTLSTTTISDIPCTIAACYHARNLHTPLFNPHYPKLATLVRRATKRKLDALHDGVDPLGE